MKSVRVSVSFIVIFLIACITSSYAGENFVTSENLTSDDVKLFVETLFLNETSIGSASHVTIEDIEQKADCTIVNCDFSYTETPFANVKHEARTVTFKRTNSGKWIHVETGKYLTK